MKFNHRKWQQQGLKNLLRVHYFRRTQPRQRIFSHRIPQEPTRRLNWKEIISPFASKKYARNKCSQKTSRSAENKSETVITYSELKFEQHCAAGNGKWAAREIWQEMGSRSRKIISITVRGSLGELFSRLWAFSKTFNFLKAFLDYCSGLVCLFMKTQTKCQKTT